MVLIMILELLMILQIFHYSIIELFVLVHQHIYHNMYLISNLILMIINFHVKSNLDYFSGNNNITLEVVYNFDL